MKRAYILVISILLLNKTDAQVPVSQVESIVNNCKQIMRETDRQILHRAFLDNNGYQEDPDNSTEWSFFLYFDSEGKLKKTKTVYYRDHYESCWTYYNTAGVAMYSSYYSRSMNGIYSIERYLDEEGRLLYLNHVSKADEPDPASVEYIVDEQIIRRASPAAVIPKIENVFYDDVFSSADYINKYVETFDFDGKITKPENTQAVKFSAPLKGDTTSLSRNDVYVYQNPSFDSRIKDKLYIRRDIVILDKKGEWYKIALSNSSDKSFEGYIHQDCLMPIEKSVCLVDGQKSRGMSK